MIETAGLSVRYPRAEHESLTGVDWSVGEGAFAVVAGPSGGGKSTLLKCLNGLIPHLSGGQFGGSVLVDGHDTRLYGPRTLSRVVGYVFQDPDGQAVAASVADEIAFSMEQLGVAPAIMRTRVEEMLDLLGIASLRDRVVTTLSGGERQRLAIAAAMALHPKVIVLDEPTSQLDPWGAGDVINALAQLNADLNVTVVIAEHRIDRLLPNMDAMTWLEHGRIAASGALDEILPSLPDVSLPPVAILARRLRMDPMPRTIKEFKRRLTGWTPSLRLTVPATSSGERLIAATGVTVRAGRQVILNSVDLTGHAGEIIALMGRNGSGKTTLLRTLFGFVTLERGQIQVAGLDMRTHRPDELGQRAAYLPQRSGSVLFNETVRAEIAFTTRQRICHSSSDWLIETLGLFDLLDRDPRDLSEGERLRAALSAVLAGDPRVVLLDEPTRGLDADQKQRLAAMLRVLRGRGVCIVLSTHDVELAASLADRVVLLGRGEVIAEGSPRDVLAGSMTFSTQINRLFGRGFLTLADIDFTASPGLEDTSGALATSSALAASGIRQ